MSYVKLPIMDESGYVVLDPYDQAGDPAEWLDIEFVDWKSSGETRFAPLASAYGDLECNGFWHHDPPKTDKDGVWVPQNVQRASRLVARAEEPGANIGRCRVIELQPNSYADCLYNLHRDDNNRLNPEGTGWIVRGFFNLTDDADSVMILREDQHDPATETRIPLPAGTQVDDRHPAALARRVAPGKPSALLPDHFMGVRPRAGRLHQCAQSAHPRTEQRTGSGLRAGRVRRCGSALRRESRSGQGPAAGSQVRSVTAPRLGKPARAATRV